MPIDYDACFSMHPDDAPRLTALIGRLSTVGRLRIVPLHDSMRSPILAQCACCVIGVGAHTAHPWDSPAFYQELAHRSAAGMLRVIILLLPDAHHATARLTALQPIAWLHWNAGADVAAMAALYAAILGTGTSSQPRLGRSPDTPLPSPIGVALLPVPEVLMERPEGATLQAIWAARSRGVVAVVGMGGAGKTALVSRFLLEVPGSSVTRHDIPKDPRLPTPAGVMAWNFYEQPDLEVFVRTLYTYVTGDSSARPARDLAYRVMEELAAHPERRVLLVLDGLEALQEEASVAEPHGLFRDSSLRHVLRQAATGMLGVLIVLTSRFPFPDLAGMGAYHQIDVGALPVPTGRMLLRAHGVQGMDAALDALVGAFGAHPLTLTLLGSLSRGHTDDLLRLSRVRVPQDGSASPVEWQGQQLGQVLALHAQALSALEHQLMAVICAARMPLAVRVVTEIGSSLQAEPALVVHALAALQARRLIAVVDGDERYVAAAHLAIRAFFARGPQAVSLDAHQLLRSTVTDWLIPGSMQALGLPIEPPMTPYHTRSADQSASVNILDDPVFLTMVEEACYHSLWMRSPEEQLAFYAKVMAIPRGGYRLLGWAAADYQRGLRITAGLVARGGMALEGNHNVYPWYERCLYLMDLGYLAQAEADLRALQAYYPTTLREQRNDGASAVPRFFGEQARVNWLYYESALLRSLSDVLLLQGHLVAAEQQADEACATLSTTDWSESQRHHSAEAGVAIVGRRAIARFFLGDTEGAYADFATVRNYEETIDAWGASRRSGAQPTVPTVRVGYHMSFHMLLLVRQGKVRLAESMLGHSALFVTRTHAPLLAAQVDLALAEVALAQGDAVGAIRHLDLARGWSITTGQREIYIRATLGTARVRLRADEQQAAANLLAEAAAAARASGYRIWLTDTLIVAGHQLLNQGALDQALEHATEAFMLSADPACGYRWGIAGATHLLAVIETQRGERERAIAHAEAAMVLRTTLNDAKLANTRQLVERLRNTKKGA
jgi:tetratricopeptide (TPR) repeat protein